MRGFALWAAVGCSLAASSCALPPLGRTASRDPAEETMHALYRVAATDAANAKVGQPQRTSEPGVIQQLSHEVAAKTPQTAAGDVPQVIAGAVREWPALPAGPVHPFAPPAVQAQYETTGCPTPGCFPSEPRIALPTESLSLKDCPLPWSPGTEVPVPVCEPEVFADEYLCDGGDRGLPVHYHGHEIAGLETEDTVAEYVDDLGDRHVKPSTRVCVYAPQFAAVRSASLPEMNTTVDRAVGAHDGRATAGLNNRLSALEELHNDQPIGVDVRSRASGLDTDAATDSLAQIDAAVSHIKLINLFEDRSFFQRGQLDQAQEAYLAYGLQAAFVWTRDLSPTIIASDTAGQEVTARFTAENYTGVEDKRTPGCLKIIKLADRHAAHPGDVVTFTIHYDNVGQRELTKVRIIDNLTPRLEFIDGSADSDRDGKLVVEQNGEGSLVLTYELAEPLPGETGGTVTFQARVR